MEVDHECWVVVTDAAGNTLRRWLAATTAEDSWCGFSSLAIDAYGNTYATVYGMDRSGYGYIPDPEVLVFDRYGRERTRFGGADTLRTPAGIDVGADGTVAVADQLGHRVQLFAPRVRYAFGGFAPPIGPESERA